MRRRRRQVQQRKAKKVEVSADKKATGKPPSRLTTAAKAKPTDKKIE